MILLGVPLNEVLATITRLMEAHSTEYEVVQASDHVARPLIFVSLSSSLS